eukprot:5428667-Amphidinium_carterae.3
MLLQYLWFRCSEVVTVDEQIWCVTISLVVGKHKHACMHIVTIQSWDVELHHPQLIGGVKVLTAAHNLGPLYSGDLRNTEAYPASSFENTMLRTCLN